MESWKRVWRNGFVPLLSEKALQGLLEALETDDSRLVQGSTTTPPPLSCVSDWPCEAACGIGYAGAVEMGGLLPPPSYERSLGEVPGMSQQAGSPPAVVATVGEVEEYFAKMCWECDKLLHEPAGCRFFLNWFDETPRDEMIALLIQEVQLALAQKEAENAE